jgi:hypothetical protein
MILASVLSGYLEQAIRTKMVKLPKDLDKGLFRNYGPLSHFKARIDVAFALGLSQPRCIRSSTSCAM